MNRFIWAITTVIFGIVGAITGWLIGITYATSAVHNLPNSMRDPTKFAVAGTLAISVTIVMARLGSWSSDRYVVPGLRRFQNLSMADRVLGIVGALLGLLFGVLSTLPITVYLFSQQSKYAPFWLPADLCIIIVSAAIGMALLTGMRAEMLRVFPQLEAPTSPMGGGAGASLKLMDTNVIIDGRMADLCKTGFIEGTIYVPHFVLEEVQYIADSSDSTRRARGRRGLEMLNTMREIEAPGNGHKSTGTIVKVLNDIPASVQQIDTVDSKLVFLAKELKAAIVTNDFNLNRVAELQGVQVLNINELAQALKPVVLPGEEMNLTIVKEGKEPGQGVGYLEDGTMVVVSDGNRHVGETCKVVISSVYQTLAGKMIFAEMKGMKGAGEDLFHEGGGGKSADDHGNRPGGGVRRKGRPER